MEFTEQIKFEWIKALNSGEFVQGRVRMNTVPGEKWNVSHQPEDCALSVLGKIFSLKYPMDSALEMGLPVWDIIKANDSERNFGNYLNVLPLIRSIPTIPHPLYKNVPHGNS